MPAYCTSKGPFKLNKMKAVISHVTPLICDLFSRYLKSKKYVNRSRIYSDALMASSYARDLLEIREKSYQKVH